jgi:type II secretory pathway component PulC
MAYSGSTAASSVANPPALMVASVKGSPAFWSYASTHTTTNAKTSNFFTDAKALGVQQGDLLFGINNASTSAPKAYFGVFGAVTTSGAALQSAASSTSA